MKGIDRFSLLNGAVLGMTTLLLWACQSQSSFDPGSPNVIIIFTDDQGYQDVGVFGAEGFTTPHLDRLASEGTMLTDFYAAQPVCSASRAGLLTGCYPNRLGIHGAYMPESQEGLNPNETTIAEMLKPQGYASAVFGKWHLGDEPEFLPTRQGFDEYFGIPYSNDMWPLHPQQGSGFNFGPLPLYEQEKIIDTLTNQSQLTTWITERSVDFIHRKKDQPFFLYVAHPQPHVPLFVSEKFKGKSERGLYGDVIMEIDWSVGEILKALEEYGLRENTLVLFTSDNGPWLSYGEHAGSAKPLREGKGAAWEGGQREPFIVSFPGRIPEGKTLETPMMAIDLLPTIAEVTGAPLPEKTIDGKSAWDLWTGKSRESPQQAYFFYYRANELHGIRYRNWKMYFPHEYRTLGGRPGGKNGLPVPYEHRTLDSIELYDLSQDISETRNVASLHPDVVDSLSRLADSMRVRLGDRLVEREGKENRTVGFSGSD